MSKQINLLIDLQKIDLALDKINSKKIDLPGERSILEDGFKQATVKFDNVKNRLEEAGKTHRQKEENLKRSIENLKKTKDRLLEVKTNKEYQAMLKEIEGIEKKNSELEDEIIFALDEIDSAKKVIQESEKELKEYQKKYEDEAALIDKELSTIDQEFEDLKKAKEDLLAQIEQNLIKRYETIKNRRNGRAVVPVWKAICDGCHMNIPPQLYIELQKTDEIIQCPFCNRIIYWDKNRNE